MKKLIITSVLILVVLTALFYLYRTWTSPLGHPVSKWDTASSLTSTSSDSAGAKSPIPPAGTRLYENRHYLFSLTYPNNLSFKEFDEGNNSETITFEDPVLGRGFQIFITPYAEDHITTERFRRDIPSGEIKDQTEILIAGARGVIFFSRNAIMGATREVWFIRGGYLYEVTTYKDADAWLSQIMTTWRWQ